MLESGLSEELDADEELARFIVSSGWVAKSTGRIKHPAFLPAPNNETSVSRISSLPGEGIEQIGRTQLGDKARHGAAIFRVYAATQSGIDAVACEPPPRHANLVGWAVDEDPKAMKAERKLAAMQIAEEARWMPWSDGIG